MFQDFPEKVVVLINIDNKHILSRVSLVFKKQ